MKQKFMRLVSLVLAFMMVMSILTPVVAASEKTAEVMVGETVKLSILGISPRITWESTNEEVATVSNGMVTGIAPGEATITATSRNFFGHGRETVTRYNITVYEADEDALTIKLGSKVQLELETNGGKVTWKSSNRRIAKVDSKGRVTGVREGTATITATEKKTITTSPFWWLGIGSREIIKTTTTFEVVVADYKYVTFNSNGGSEIEPIMVKNGMPITPDESLIPTKDGFVFENWYTDEALENVYDSTPITEDIELYAKWEEEKPEDDNSEPENDDSTIDEYYANNSEVIDVIDANESNDLLTETQAKAMLEERGFVDCQITYEYSMDGSYNDETEVSDSSTEKHPMYQTFYISDNDELWVIYVINDEIYANPLSFNLESDLEAQLIVSESEEFTSYEGENNKFYIIIPYTTMVIAEIVDRIDAETLDKLTIEEICRLSGATMPASTDEHVENEENSEENTIVYSKNDSSEKAPLSSATEKEIVSSVAETEEDDPLIVVSLGDSFSAGEGILDYYGQDKPLEQKVQDEDWLAHRSMNSWPSQLTVPGIPEGKTLGDYRVANDETGENRPIQWYFCAVSGAKTKNIMSGQKKEYFHQETVNIGMDEFVVGIEIATKKDDTAVDIDPQLKVFDRDDIKGKVDYVTLTTGGNDVGFASVMAACVLNVPFSTGNLEKELGTTWEKIDGTMSQIGDLYDEIETKAGKQATIIVAGYPHLLDENGRGAIISKKEAELVNEKITAFNKKIEALVREKEKNGMNIFFVDVETYFKTHQAYSKPEPWIEGFNVLPREEDLINTVKAIGTFGKDAVYSASSFHPNKDGAQAYAYRVNTEIAERGILSGKICKAADRITAIPNASVKVYKDGALYTSRIADDEGNYTINLPDGRYLVKISSEGYMEFKAYATVVAGEKVYMETFLLIEGSETETGIAKGKVVNSLTGAGAATVTLTVKKDWNNTDEASETVQTAITDASGNYSVELPLGNYTVIATKDGYTSSSFNIVVQDGTTGNQNGSITPLISGDSYLITLTWGTNPSDLDSHVVGTLSSGSTFHVYYSHKSQYDGDIEVCNLDYDDTTSYGPEHITLNTTNETPYYYYIYKYAGSGTVGNSGAKITIEQGNTLIAEFNVPTDLGGADYWNVFAIKNGELIVNNTITSSPNLQYAN